MRKTHNYDNHSHITQQQRREANLTGVPLLSILQEKVDHHEQQQEREQDDMRKPDEDQAHPEGSDVLEKRPPDRKL